MEAYKKQIGDIFPRNKLLEIPFYQRAYVWSSEEWERLLEDLKGMCERKEEYFLGSVILKDTIISGPNEENFAGKFVVVDGQQRLTTLLVMMKVIALISDDMDTFDSFFITSKKKKGEVVFTAPSLRHNYKDRPDFERILALKELQELEGTSKGVEAYNFFRTHIDEATADLMNLSDMTSLMNFVMITVNDSEDEQQIFDTINSLGVRLTTAELLKNYFFSNEDRELFETHWEGLFEKDEETRAYWDQEIVTGRFKRTLIDLFFDSLLQILVQDVELHVKDEDKKAYEKVEKLFHSYRDFIEIKKFRSKDYVLNVIKPYAERFRETFNPANTTACVPRKPSVERMNVVIFGLKNSTVIPYVLYLRSQIDDGATFEEMLGILESFIMRRMACRATTKNYNRFFNSLIRDEIKTPGQLREKLSNQDDVTTSFPGDEELEAQFQDDYKFVSLQARGILYLIETAVWPEDSGTTMLGFDTYSLEHMMPKKWRNHWDRLDSEEAEEARDKKILTLGNLAIIPQTLNGAISDSNWPDKKKGNKKHDGLALCAGGLRTMEKPLASDEWNELLMSDRAEELFGYAREIWKL